MNLHQWMLLWLVLMAGALAIAEGMGAVVLLIAIGLGLVTRG